jgi:iron complex outermembrane receptor protein
MDRTRVSTTAQLLAGALAFAPIHGNAQAQNAPKATPHRGSNTEQPTRLDALQVTASPVHTATSKTPRSVWVIEREDIERSPAANLADLLAQQPGLSIQRRGAPGVQADLGIRGSNFEQTLILIDGVPVQNPQAGHHNLDIPIPLAHIERIEIVKGPGAIQFRGSATGGVINLITRRPKDRELSAAVMLGSHATRAVNARVAMPLGASQHGLSVGGMDTDGDDRSGPSDARVREALYTGSNQHGALDLSFGAGSMERDFGAWGFYSAEYPNAREHTDMQLAWLGADVRRGAWQLSVRAHANQHDDWFLTRIGSRDYINEHQTQVTGLQATARHQDAFGTTAFGTDLRHERLESNALQNHRRDKSSFWILRQQELGPETLAELSINRAQFYAHRGQWLPAFALSHGFDKTWRGFIASARSAREPSYTELFLKTSANRGAADLQPEVSKATEIGIEGQTDTQTLRMAVYQRHTRHWIDWTRSPGTVTWIASNVDEYRGRGFEATWRWRPAVEWLDGLTLGYDRLKVAIDAFGREVKYASQVPSHTWLADAQITLGAGVTADLALRRPSYADQDAATLADLKFAWRGDHLRTFIQVHNLGDENIIETGFAPIPGRWINVGVGFDLR